MYDTRWPIWGRHRGVLCLLGCCSLQRVAGAHCLRTELFVPVSCLSHSPQFPPSMIQFTCAGHRQQYCPPDQSWSNQNYLRNSDYYPLISHILAKQFHLWRLACNSQLGCGAAPDSSGQTRMHTCPLRWSVPFEGRRLCPCQKKILLSFA